MLKVLAEKYSHADALITLALIALIYMAWRSATVDLAAFGEGVAAIFTGRGIHAASTSWGNAQAGS